MLIQNDVHKIASDPSLLWKNLNAVMVLLSVVFQKNVRLIIIKVNFRRLTFLQKVKNEKELDCLLANSMYSAFIVTPSDVEFTVKKLRKN